MTEAPTILFKFLHEYTQKLRIFKELLAACDHMCDPGKGVYISMIESKMLKKSKQINPIKRFLLLYSIFLGDITFLEKLKSKGLLQIESSLLSSQQLNSIQVAGISKTPQIKYTGINIIDENTKF